MTETPGVGPGGSGGEGLRSPDRSTIRVIPEVARNVMATGDRRYLDFGKNLSTTERPQLKKALMGKEHVDQVPLARALARRIISNSSEDRAAEREEYLSAETGVDRWISYYLEHPQQEPQLTKALKLLSTKAGGRITSEYIYDNYLYPQGENEREIVAKVIAKRSEMMEALVGGCRREDGVVDMAQLRDMLVGREEDEESEGIDSIFESDGILWATMTEGMLQQPVVIEEEVGGQVRKRAIKGPMLDQAFTVGQVVPADMDPDTRDMFVELERASRVHLESYGASSRGGRPNKPDEDAYFTPQEGFHPGDIGGEGTEVRDPRTGNFLHSRNHEATIDERKRGLAEALTGLTLRSERLIITPEDIDAVAKRIQDLQKDGLLGGLDIVADGMGGHGHGEYASSIATFIFTQEIARALSVSAGDISEEDIRNAVLLADDAIGIYNGGKKDSGTTFTAQITDKNGDTFALSIGDARTYKKDANGDVVRLTNDDSYVEQQLVYAGDIAPSEVLTHYLKIDPGKALQHGNLKAEDIAIVSTRLSPGEHLLLVCDGVWEGVTHDTLIALDSRVIRAARDTRKQYEIDLENFGQTHFRDDQEQRAAFARIRQEVLADICGDINREYRVVVGRGTLPQEAMNIAQGKIFQRLILRGREHLGMRELARDLASVAVGQASGDNVTAVVVEHPLDESDQSSVSLPKPSPERGGTEERSDLRGGAWPTIGVAKVLLGSIDPEFYNPTTIVTEADARRLRKQLNGLKEVDLMPSARAKVLAQGVDEGSLREEVYIEADRRKRFINDLIRAHRTLPGGVIDIPGLQEEIFHRDRNMPEEDRDLLYLTLAQSLLLVPKAQKEGWLDRVIEVSMQPLSNDTELFESLYSNRETQKKKRA